MYSIQVDQDISCRTVGRCTYGAALDHEILKSGCLAKWTKG